MTPQPSMKRGRQWLNRVSTELGEGQQSLTKQEWQSVKKLFDRARFWDLGHNHRPDIKDGAGWLTERVDGNRYHVVHMWSPEMGLYREACLNLLKLSNLPLDPIY